MKINIFESTESLRNFFKSFSGLSTDFVVAYKGKKELTRAEKEDLRDFNQDVSSFEKFIDFHKGLEAQFTKAVKKGQISKESFKEWERDLYNAELALKACKIASEIKGVEIGIVEGEEYAPKDIIFYYAEEPVIYRAYERKNFEAYILNKENENSLQDDGIEVE